MILKINRIKENLISNSEIISELEKKCNNEYLDKVNWTEFPYKPDVKFNIGFNSNSIFILYKVIEEGVRATETEFNSRVWEDSCCEFFCSFDDTGYYNLEVNCIGTPLLGFRKSRDLAEHASDALMKKIRTYSTLGSKPFGIKKGKYEYKLLVEVPAKTFFKHKINLGEEFSFNANLYKCGDKAPNMHFLSWSPIKIDEPDFHRPEFFNKAILMALPKV
ncbi:MAG: carbohydrate-binding family 9-like protein [Bacteroidota bacterium]